MTAAGPNFPSAAVNLSNAGTSESAEAWINPTNVFSDNAAEAAITAATYDSPDISQILVASGFGFSIPADAVIDGIIVEIDRRSIIASSGKDFRVQLAKGTAFANLVGSNLAVPATIWPTTSGIATYGGAANLWGTTWTPAEINAASFALFVSCQANIANADVGIDFVRITIHYTAATPIVGSDAGSGADSSSASAAFDLTDVGGGVDASSGAASYAATDAGAGTETADMVRAFVGNDTGAGADTASLEISVDKVGSDAGVGTEQVTERATALADAGAGIDTAEAPGGALAATDAATGADLTAALERETGDTAIGVESLGDRGFVAADTAVGVDASVLQSGDNRNASESAAGIDVVSVTVELSASDAGAGIDALGTLEVVASTTDSGIGADNASGATFSIPPPSISDVGVGVESAIVTIGVTSPSTALEIAVRDMLYAALPSAKLDESSAEPDAYRKNTLYLWEDMDDRRPRDRNQFRFVAVYAADDAGEEARMQDGKRSVSNVLDTAASALVAAIRQNQHADKWANLTASVDPDFLASYGKRGFAIRIDGYRL